jgi:protoporphyrinogen oxidase
VSRPGDGAGGWSRRAVLTAAAAGFGLGGYVALVGWAVGAGCTAAPAPAGPWRGPGGFLEPDLTTGHRLRPPEPGSAGEPKTQTAIRTETHTHGGRSERVTVAIVGGGVAGLSAAWALRRAGVDDVKVYELDAEVGGTARGARTDGRAHPLGAHYLPQPSPESVAVRALLVELGVITGHDARGEPIYDATMLCQAPEHRLFQGGRWIDGLYPRVGATRSELDEQDRLQAELATLRAARGVDGRRVFALPRARSSADPAWTALDRSSLAAWLDARGYRSPRTRWWVEYAVRDDYGTTLETTSAWAGLHYFCARGLEDPEVLTWPEGNGWLVEQLRRRLEPTLVTGALVTRVTPPEGPGPVRLALVRDGRPATVEAEHVVVATPHFVAARIVEGVARRPELTYAPWLVAHLHVPAPPVGAAWDNVLYESDALGYVVSTHQSLAVHPGPAVLSWYKPLAAGDPVEARRGLLEATHATLAETALRDLERAHRDLRRHVTRIDVTRWGHGMVRPTPGLISGGALDALATPTEGARLTFAHSDLSGLALFEEAQDQGVRAAELILGALGVRAASLREG